MALKIFSVYSKDGGILDCPAPSIFNCNQIIYQGDEVVILDNTEITVTNISYLGRSYQLMGTEEQIKITCKGCSNSSCWVPLLISYEDFSIDATTNSVEKFVSVPGGMVQAAILKHSEEFLGGGISAYTLSVGTPSLLPDTYISAFDVFQAPASNLFATSGGFAPPLITDFENPTSIRVYTESTGANLDQATQGKAILYLYVSQLPL